MPTMGAHTATSATSPSAADTVDLRGRDLLREFDHSAAELSALLTLSARLKDARRRGTEQQHLRGRAIALVFEKSSTRTRSSFEVAAFHQGGHAAVLDPSSSHIGTKESTADTARVLSRIYDGIQFRGAGQEVIEELAEYSDVPVWNGLTDEWHPTQMLADFLTMAEHGGGRSVQETSYAYLGDARSNMGNSLLAMGAIMGSDVRIVGPKALWPAESVLAEAQARAAQSGARILLTEDVAEGVAGVDYLHTDVWVSMGEPATVWDERVALLLPYRVDAGVLAATGNPDVKFLHCLPAYHDELTEVGRAITAQTGITGGLEVTGEVFDSPASVVFDQAENRLHTIKAILVATLATENVLATLD
jgi:ornithine carbamoyltransferase